MCKSLKTYAPVLILLCGIAALIPPSEAYSYQKFEKETHVHSADATITAKVKKALKADNETRSLKLHIRTRQGVVTLSGHVSPSEGKKAVDIARGIEGVRDASFCDCDSCKRDCDCCP